MIVIFSILQFQNRRKIMTQTQQDFIKRGSMSSGPISKLRKNLQSKKKYITEQLQNLQKQMQSSSCKPQSELSKQLQTRSYCLAHQKIINPLSILSQIRNLPPQSHCVIHNPTLIALNTRNPTKMHTPVQTPCSCNEQIPYFKKNQNYMQKQFQIVEMPHGKFYPPSCAGYDIAYCKSSEMIYVYGGISCTSELSNGLKHYFFAYKDGQGWGEVKIGGNYGPIPRYGHTLTGGHGFLLLFGGVSEYKEKLKDRCFYSDVWSFSTQKNAWKVLEFSGIMPKTRRNHVACFYQKYYIIQGGLDDSEQVISSISWVNLDEKKGRWRHKVMQGRYNHQIAVHQTQHGRDFLFVFGGRNTESEIIGNFVMYPINVSEGQLHFKQSFKFNWGLQACQFPIMKNIDNGVIIMGGINQQNQAAEQCYYFNPQKQCGIAIQNNIQWNQLRSAKGVSLNNKQIYILSGANSKKYKAIKIQMSQDRDDEFKFKN